jgi:hypothetical protein
MMKTTLNGLLVALAVLGTMGNGIARAEECSGSIDEAEVLAAEDARYLAQTRDDFSAMEKLLGADLVYTHSTALVDGKASYIESLRSGNVKYRSMSRSDAKVRIYGCLGALTGTANFDVTVKGQEIAVELRFMSLWAKRASGLQFVGWQATRVPGK